MDVRLTLDESAIQQLTDAKISAGLTRVAVYIEGEVKRKLSQPGTGRVVGRHRASSPGRPPAVDTGRLRASITHKVEDKVARIGTNVEYAKFLEFGTRKMAARPFLRPVLTEKKDEIVAQFVRGAQR